MGPEQQSFYAAGAVLIITTPSGDVLRMPLTTVLANAQLASRSYYSGLGGALFAPAEGDPLEVFRYRWLDNQVCEDPEGCDEVCDVCAGPPVWRGARLMVEEIPI